MSSGDVATGVKTLILGGARGTALAAEIKSSGDASLQSLVKPGDRCEPCLLPVDGVASLEYWLGCVDGVAKCGKGPSSVFVTHAADAKGDFEALPDLAPSGGRCTAVSNGADHSMPIPGPAGDLLTALEDAVGYDSHVLVIDGSYLCAPDYDLNGFVEHAVMRGKDAVAYVNVDASDAGVRPRLSLEKNPAGRTVSNPEVVSVTPYPDARANGSGGTVSVCGPVMFLRRTTLPLVAEFFADEGLRWSESGVAPDEMLGRLLVFLQKRETVYALEMKHCFAPGVSVGTYVYVNELFGFLSGEKARATGRYKSEWASGSKKRAALSGQQGAHMPAHRPAPAPWRPPSFDIPGRTRRVTFRQFRRARSITSLAGPHGAVPVSDVSLESTTASHGAAEGGAAPGSELVPSTPSQVELVCSPTNVVLYLFKLMKYIHKGSDVITAPMDAR